MKHKVISKNVNVMRIGYRPTSSRTIENAINMVTQDICSELLTDGYLKITNEPSKDKVTFTGELVVIKKEDYDEMMGGSIDNVIKFTTNNTNFFSGLCPIEEITDGYHTFKDLYYQRLVLFATLCNTFKSLSWKSHKHSDGEECFGGGWFVVGINTPEGNYTYHYEDQYWDMFECKEIEFAPVWDGHTSSDVERLLGLVGEY